MKGPVNTPGYVLPKATEDTLGGVKVGENLDVEDGKLSVKTDGVWAVIKAKADAIYSLIGHRHDNATKTADGFMSATDKATLDAVPPTYIKALSVNGQTVTYTKGDGSTGTIKTQDSQYSVFTGASDSAAGTKGLVPTPAAGAQEKYLRGDGTWTSIADGFTVASLPSQSGSLTYTGSAQSPAWSGYDSAQIAIVGGTTLATNAGTYSLQFAPKVGYCWSDSTMAAKSASWTIVKKMPTHSYKLSSGSGHFIINIYTTEITANITIATSNRKVYSYGDTGWQGGAGSYSRTIYMAYETNLGDVTVSFGFAETSNYYGFTISGIYNGYADTKWKEISS